MAYQWPVTLQDSTYRKFQVNWLLTYETVPDQPLSRFLQKSFNNVSENDKFTFQLNIEDLTNGTWTELQNVKSFTRTKIFKTDFTPRKARKLQQFWHFKPTKQNLWGFFWWINVDKLSIYVILSIDLKFFAHIFPKMACFC